MKRISVVRLFILVIVSVCSSDLTIAQTESAALDATIHKTGVIEFKTKDGKTKRSFLPEFTVLYRADDPGLGQNRYAKIAYTLPYWKSFDGLDPQTRDYYRSAEVITTKANKLVGQGEQYTLLFPEHALFSLEVEVVLPQGGLPELIYRFIPKKEGYFSVGYTGAFQSAPDKLEALWQPFIWQELRFPDQCYLSTDHSSSLPATTITYRGITSGVVVSPSAIPYQMPDFSRLKYGLMVHNRKGAAQPQVFSPVLGATNSKMGPGDQYTYSFRLFAVEGAWIDAYKYLAYDLFGFSDYRSNATCSLNETIENMVQFAMNDYYSGWNEELKAFDYTTDVKHTVKLVSSLHPLSIAVITDNEEIYERRAKPMMEYLMSREKYLFSSIKGVTGQSPSHAMRGPAAEVSELGALYAFSQQRTPVFSHYTLDLLDKPRALNLQLMSEGRSWQNLLAVYRATGEQQYLDEAKLKAKDYIKNRIETPQRDFSDANIYEALGGQFWTDFAPKWIDLIELYEATGDSTFLDAALAGAHAYTGFVWFQPVIPAGEVLINKSGVLPMGDRHNKANPRPIEVAPQKVPAWRVSQIGLTPESSYTYSANQGMFMANFAPWMLRMAHYTGDGFLRDIARSAIVGRYANFPGYDINIEFTNFYERPDYPLRNWKELTYNQIYYNHVWPHIALLTDFLITQSIYKSGGKIYFPSQYAQGYAYLQSKVYGSAPGTFYGDSGVRLWMPAQLLRSDNIQVNYVSGYGNGNFYLALMNQSDAAIEPTMTLHPDLVPVDVGNTYTLRVWDQDGNQSSGIMEGGSLTTTIPPKSMVSVSIDSLAAFPRFQKRFYDEDAKALGRESYLEVDTPFGKVTGMIMRMGAGLTHAYVWLQADEEVLHGATLQYRVDQEWLNNQDTSFPFEYSIPLSNVDRKIDFKLKVKTTDEKIIETDEYTLYVR
jgi:hypothetical protein